MPKKEVPAQTTSPTEIHRPLIDAAKIKEHIQQKLQEAQPHRKIPISGQEYVGTGVVGLDELFMNGIPRGSSILTIGGPGSGKTIFCLQTLYHAAKAGERVFYITLEETPETLRKHMKDFGWDIAPLEKSGHFMIRKFTPMDITRQIDAMMERIKGELLIDIRPMVIPSDYKPDRVAIDSLSAVASALYGKEESYRIYIEQLFNIFKEIGATTFLISESNDPGVKLSSSGSEEFLADGVFIFYNLRQGNVRESAFEILKMRGSGFKKKIVPFQIKTGQGIVVYPEQEVFTLA
ncbi:AAA family ATPase [Candidatus Woesearchaeota archaeon]|nr:AAA family ATPase [Candidatus Woesearchaeota archaeon]